MPGHKESFQAVETALQAVTALIGRLPPGTDEGHVRRSADELRLAVAQREAIRPAVDRLLQSVRDLQHASLSGRRRDYQSGTESVDRLVEAIQQRLLPALSHITSGRNSPTGD